MAEAKPALQSKTVIFSMIIAAMGVIEMNMPMLKEMMGDYYGVAFIAISAISVALRSVTDTPLNAKKLL